MSYPDLIEEWEAYRPTSKAGEARGESSVVMVKTPSNFLSGYGAVTVAEMRVRTLEDCVSGVQTNMETAMCLVSPTRTSATPYSSPGNISMFLYASRARPSTRIFCRKASRIKVRSLFDGSASRGMTNGSAMSKGRSIEESRE